MADEEDDDVLESWEDAIETEDFERRMEEREKHLNIDLSEEKIMSITPMTILQGNSASPTAYSPQIKILKRSNVDNANANKPKNKTEAELKQTLKLREAEYQAARNRIMGENYDETKPKLDNNEEAKISIIRNPNRTSPVGSPSSPVRVLSPKLKSAVNLNDANILRQPCGPDDTSGFKVIR